MKRMRNRARFRDNLVTTYLNFEPLFFYVLIPCILITGYSMYYAVDLMKSSSGLSYLFHNSRRGGASIQIFEVEGVKSNKIPPKPSVTTEFKRRITGTFFQK